MGERYFDAGYDHAIPNSGEFATTVVTRKDANPLKLSHWILSEPAANRHRRREQRHLAKRFVCPVFGVCAIDGTMRVGQFTLM